MGRVMLIWGKMTHQLVRTTIEIMLKEKPKKKWIDKLVHENPGVNKRLWNN